MVFKMNLHDNVVFNDYLTHLASGLPANGWYIKAGKHHVTAKSISAYLGTEFDMSIAELAKARGLQARYKEMIHLMEDPKTAIANLAVLKCVHETFFADSINETLDPGLLMSTVNEIIKSSAYTGADTANASFANSTDPSQNGDPMALYV